MQFNTICKDYDSINPAFTPIHTHHRSTGGAGANHDHAGRGRTDAGAYTSGTQKNTPPHQKKSMNPNSEPFGDIHTLNSTLRTYTFNLVRGLKKKQPRDTM